MQWLRHGVLALWLFVCVGAADIARAANSANTDALPSSPAIPALSGHVVDVVGLLTPEAQSRLEQKLSDVEVRSGSQIALLLMSTTAPETIEQFSIRVADTWKLGRKNVDDGVILLVAKDNPKTLHRLRIEAGRGVQGSLTDLQSKRILQEIIAPYFQRNDFDGGLNAGVDAIITLLDKEQLPAPPATSAPSPNSSISNSVTGALPFILFIVFIGISVWMRNRRGRGTLRSGGWGNSAGVILGSTIGNAIGNATRHGSGSAGGWTGGSSGGGISGGGGSFDGGGASGDW